MPRIESFPDMPGITTAHSSLGGRVVRKDGQVIGWMHDQPGGKWTAYVRVPYSTNGRPIGTYERDAAVRRIVEVAG